MLNYVAFSWDPNDHESNEAARLLMRSASAQINTWQHAFHADGFDVFCTGTRTGSRDIYPLTERGGVVLGALFPRSQSSAAPWLNPKLNESQSRGIVASAGRELIDRYWGHYVAFIYDRATRTKWVLRDPAMGLECLTTRFRGVDIYFSSLAHCLPLQALTLTVNWDYIATELATVVLDTRATGLNEITRVVGGECIETRGRSRRRMFYWHPFDFVSQPIDDSDGAQEQLRSDVFSCIHGWASRYERILLALSGGLDSSIVLGCLSTAPTRPEVTCITHYSRASTNSDERHFAQLAAKRAGRPLIECEANAQMNIEPFAAVSPSESPCSLLSALQVSSTEPEVARSTGAQAIFRGIGGDELFAQGGRPYACADYLQRHLLGKRTLPLAIESASAEGGTIWQVLSAALKARRSKDRLSLLLDRCVYSSLTSAAMIEFTKQRRLQLHPWLERRDRVPPIGKLWQIYTLAHSISGYDPFAPPDASAEHVFPLFSQPLIETCLRIPTYLLSHSGWNRILARRAFAAEVPEEILWRRSKGETGNLVKRLLAHNNRFIREHILDGELASRGLLGASEDRDDPVGRRTQGKRRRADVAAVQLSVHRTVARALERQAAADCGLTFGPQLFVQNCGIVLERRERRRARSCLVLLLQYH